MVNKMILPMVLALLTGCSGLTEKIKNTELRDEYFSAGVSSTHSCIHYQSIRHHFYFEKEDPLPNGSKRFNLIRSDAPVVTLDMKKSGSQTLVNFFYDRRDKKLANDLDDIIRNCHRELD